MNTDGFNTHLFTLTALTNMSPLFQAAAELIIDDIDDD